MTKLEQFIITAKANGWVGVLKNGNKIKSSRIGSADIVYNSDNYYYHDSFVGFSDFCGQEHVTSKEKPVWSMVYYGYLLKPDIFSADNAVDILVRALSDMYLKENRFLGGYKFVLDDYEYRDMNFGDYKRFQGIEKIFYKDELVYELTYCGGTVKK